MSDLLKGTFSQDKSPTGNMSSRDFLRLIQHWQKLLEGFVAENAVPYRLKGKELHIATLHPALAQELSFMERDILLKILKHFPEWGKKLDRLHFKFYPGFKIDSFLRGLKEEQPQMPTKIVIETHQASTLTAQQKVSLKNESKEIADEEIRTLLNGLIDKL